MRKPKKSLRTILIFWFLIFSILPVTFITYYSVKKFSVSADREVTHRIQLKFKELSEELQKAAKGIVQLHQRNKIEKSLMFYLTNQQDESIKTLLKDWLSDDHINEVAIYSVQGEQIHKYTKSLKHKITEVSQSKLKLIPENVLSLVKEQDNYHVIDLHDNKIFSFSIISKIQTPNGELLGFLKESTYINAQDFKKSTRFKDINYYIYKSGYKYKIWTADELMHLSENYLRKIEEKNSYFNELINETEMRFRVNTFKWQGDKVKVILGVSNEESKMLLSQITRAFITMLLGIIVLLVILSLIISKILLDPLLALTNIFLTKDPSKERIFLSQNSHTELGLLTQGSNELFRQVYESQRKLKENIQELEKVNLAIKGTQSKMVHAAKMASLGQLVAGVAHELNNPIGFIYSNMSFLKEYSEKLIQLIESVGDNNEDLERLKEELEYKYISKDLPRLIQSCESGASRTKDIVLGLRNFSKHEEAEKKEVDLRESLDSTIELLSSSIESRISIKKDYNNIPNLFCYASELNQVFMNVLTNSVQSIESKGTIEISTRYIVDQKAIQIKIKDDGAGIRAEDLEKVFDPFFTTKPPGVGTGLGLSISYGIIEKHKGKIIIKSDHSRGTVIVIDLPV